MDKKNHQTKEEERSKQIKETLEKRKLKLLDFLTVGEIAYLMEVDVTKIISYCNYLGIIITSNHRLNYDLLMLVADEFGYSIEFVIYKDYFSYKESYLRQRAPIVTLMGHVDHGKTSLLDYIRKTNVIVKESGRITQNIIAYHVNFKEVSITFMDTPGHESFTSMRSIVTKLTDIVLIVIDADNKVMQQTNEAIHHAKSAGIPIIFAVNKIDKSTANPEKIKDQLANINLLVDDWGGKYPSQEISSKYGFGINKLLEKLVLEAEMLNLKVNYNQPATGTVIAAYLDPVLGSVTTILVQYGHLRQGSYILAGEYDGKIQVMFDELGNYLKEAIPSETVSILGLSEVPNAGDSFTVLKDEKLAKQIALKRKQKLLINKKHSNLNEIGRRILLGNLKELKIILKVDVESTIEAFIKSIKKLYNENVYLNILQKGVGQITESDVILASASDYMIIGFNVSTNIVAKNIAEKENIEIRTYSVIYDVIKDLKKYIEEMHYNEESKKLIGNAEIREIFKLPKGGNIAGCMVLDGKIISTSNVRLIRNGIVIYDGKLGSLKRFRENVKEVSKGYECGLNFKDYNNIKIGDILEIYEKKI